MSIDAWINHTQCAYLFSWIMKKASYYMDLRKRFEKKAFGIGRRVFLALLSSLLAGQLFWIYGYQRKYRQHGEFRANILKSTTTKVKEMPTVPDIPVLLWWDSVYDNVDVVKKCGPSSCRISNNRSLKNHHDTKGFLFYGSHFKPYNLPFPRKQDHTWALMHEESPRNAYILSHGNSLEIFNYTSTYYRKSNYPITTQWLRCVDWLQQTIFVLPLVDKNRLRKAGLAPVLYIHSDCGVPSDRDSYVELLQQYIEVDSYGACKHNKDMPKRLYFRENMIPLEDKEFYQFVSRYKFTLAFENYICEDYITEKVWRPLQVGSVPIVFGAPNIRDYLPSNKSAILIEDFEDVADLASYIHLLDSNDRLYLEYLEFKMEPLRSKNLLKHLNERDWEQNLCSPEGTHHQVKKSQLKRKYESIFSGFECFVCNAIKDSIEYKSTIVPGTIQPGLQDHFKCPSPRKFDQNGHYSVHDKDWSAEWLYGKYEANVLEDLYRENRTCSEMEYRQLVEAAYTEDQ